MANGREGGYAAKPSPTVGGNTQQLYDTSDIGFVVREVVTLTERISNQIEKQKESDARLEKLFDKFDKRFESIEAKIADAIKPVTDDVGKLKSQATYFKGYMAALFLVGAVAAFFFHDQLQHIAEAVAKLGK